MRSISSTSPARDFSPVPRRGVNVAQFLSQTARRIPDSFAVIDPDAGVTWTWEELDSRAEALARSLADSGVGRCDTVLLVSRNHAEMIQAFWGIIRAGGVVAPPNAALSNADLIGICDEVAPAAVIADRDHSEFVSELQSRGFSGPVLWIGELPAPDHRASAGERTYDFDVDEDDPCWYFFTSGSTGRPKAATFTHRHLGAVLANHRCDLFPSEDEEGASLVLAPLSHGAGIHMLAQVFGGTVSVINPGGRVDQDTVWHSIDRFAVTNMFTVPTILNRIVAGYPADRGPDDHSLSRVVYAGAPMLAADQHRALERLGSCLVQYFGLAEVTGAITVLRPEEHGRIPVDSSGIGTCGRARTGVEIIIVDDEGVPVGAGEPGEVCVAGPTVCAGYLARPDANSVAFANEVFHTGDIGYLNDEGFLFLTGRKSDMYISGGSNVYPREIEELLLSDPGVAQVVVVGVPDAQWGEIGIAVVEVVDDLTVAAVEHKARLTSLLKSALAAYKVPKEIHVVDQIPVTAYGKLARKDLREMYSQGRGNRR